MNPNSIDTPFSINYSETNIKQRSIKCLCYKWSNTNKSYIRRGMASKNFTELFPHVYYLFSSYMEHTIIAHKFLNAEMTLEITRPLVANTNSSDGTKLREPNSYTDSGELVTNCGLTELELMDDNNLLARQQIAEKMSNRKSDIKTTTNTATCVRIESVYDVNFNVNGDEIRQNPDGTTTHIYKLVNAGRIYTTGQFMEFMKANENMPELQQIRFIFDRIAYVDIKWSWPHNKITTASQAREMYKEMLGKRIFWPLTHDGVERRVYISVYSQLLCVAYSGNINYCNEPYGEIPIW